MSDPVFAYCSCCECGGSAANPLYRLTDVALLCDDCGRTRQTTAFRVVETYWKV